MPESGIASRARFDLIRYAQAWEDADVLVAALVTPPGASLVSIASAGDNVLALLTLDPARVIAVDLSAAQLACLRLRMAAYRRLDHRGLLELMGSRPSGRRGELLACAARGLDDADQLFWAARRSTVERHGLGGIGRFERYFRLFRRYALPLAHGGRAVAELLQSRPDAARAAGYERWNNRRWRRLISCFFSRAAMGRLGRDPAFFAFAEGSLSAHVAARTRHALVAQDPAANPYLTWILTGTHADALPLALREEHFATIRDRLDRVQCRLGALDSVTDDLQADGWNLSDIFEYMSPDEHLAAYRRILDATAAGGRLVYWNMLVPRACPDSFRPRMLCHDTELLHAADKAFFYRALRIEERRA